MPVAIRIWFTILVCWPAPASPWRTKVLPSVCQTGASASTISGSPPIMIERRASRAPTSPPETGASTAWAERARAAAAISRASCGSLVDMSTKIWAGRAAASAPSSPSSVARTSAGKPTMVKTTSEAAATARGESAHAAPRATSGSAFARVRLKTVAAKPLAIRWPHIEAPITPVPIHPRRVRPGSMIMKRVLPQLQHEPDGRREQVGGGRDDRGARERDAEQRAIEERLGGEDGQRARARARAAEADEHDRQLARQRERERGEVRAVEHGGEYGTIGRCAAPRR